MTGGVKDPGASGAAPGDRPVDRRSALDGIARDHGVDLTAPRPLRTVQGGEQ